MFGYSNSLCRENLIDTFNFTYNIPSRDPRPFTLLAIKKRGVVVIALLEIHF